MTWAISRGEKHREPQVLLLEVLKLSGTRGKASKLKEKRRRLDMRKQVC